MPYALRVSAADLAPTVGYLRLPEGKRSRVRQAMGERQRPRVGFVWCAGVWNPSRSIPYAVFQTLLEVPGLEVWSLQGEPERETWLRSSQQERRAAVHDVYRCGDGILSLATVIEQMDLVVTVDTLAAHLAGALGVPCWLLLQHRADWRWMIRRNDTPWYPSLRLFRQNTPGDWLPLVSTVRTCLQAFATDVHASGGRA